MSEKNSNPFKNEDVITEDNENSKEEEKASAEETAEDNSTDELAQLQKKYDELNNQYVRLAADFDNYRKRTLKEKTELILNGGEKVLTALLPVLDDFERAQESFKKSSDVEALREGVTLIFEKLVKTLESQGLKPIDAVGQDFNTDFHEAIAMIPAPNDDDKGKVIDCIQTGYMLNEKVIRHAKVAIGQ